MGAAAAAAILLRREREIVGAFRDARATSAGGAVTLEAVGVHDGVALRRLRQRAVVRPSNDSEPSRYYLDEPVWDATRQMRRRLVTIVVLVAVACSALMWLAGSGMTR